MRTLRIIKSSLEPLMAHLLPLSSSHIESDTIFVFYFYFKYTSKDTFSDLMWLCLFITAYSFSLKLKVFNKYFAEYQVSLDILKKSCQFSKSGMTSIQMYFKQILINLESFSWFCSRSYFLYTTHAKLIYFLTKMITLCKETV